MAKLHGNKGKLIILLDPIELERIAEKAKLEGVSASAWAGRLLREHGEDTFALGAAWIVENASSRSTLTLWIETNDPALESTLRDIAIKQVGYRYAPDFIAGMKTILAQKKD